MLEQRITEGTIRLGRASICNRYFYIYEFIDNKGKVWRYTEDCDKYDNPFDNELLNACEMIINGYNKPLILSNEKQIEYIKDYIENILANGEKCTRSYWD